MTLALFLLICWGAASHAAAASQAASLIVIPAGTLTNDGITIQISPFLIGRTEVTQADYERITGRNPSVHRGPTLPVESVTWWDAIRYCNLLSTHEGLEPVYDLNTGERDSNRTGYRLPTEAEWTLAFNQRDQSANLRKPGTKNTASLTGSTRPAPPVGLADMAGNVWEWCHDRHSAVPIVDAIFDPAGPATGPDRVIRGGGYLTTAGQWNKGLRSSRDPASPSPFTGFRIARNGNTRAVPPLFDLSRVALPSAPTQNLSPLANRQELHRRWADILGAPGLSVHRPEVRQIERINDPIYAGELLELRTEPDAWERVFLMRPHARSAQRRPVLIVPFYDVDTPAGRNLGGRRFVPLSVRSFAYMAVQQGFVAIAIRWFGESYGEGYDEAVANLKSRHPGCTGLGKWIWDAQRLLDWIATLPDVDASRIAVMGHSLGGKMALYAAAFEPRVAAVVASEPGIGLALTNYDDFWYLGENVARVPKGSDQHELIALIAPRPFLLIAGEDSDGDKSLPYMNAARPAYGSAAGRLGFFNHRKGHSPTPESVILALEWLRSALR
jgi:pimeloyl-ACP methyl ester carboxylesterase